MKTILVPTDFTECSGQAIKFASFLARKTSAEIILLHVVEESAAEPGMSTSGEWNSVLTAGSVEIPFMIGVLRETKVFMQNVLELPELKNLKVHDKIEVGPISESILKAAEKYKAEVIIMGTHGARGLKEVFVGSHAEHVVRNSTVPVISVRERYNPRPSKIIFATDFSPEADKIFASVRRFARLFDAELHLLKIILPDKFESYADSRAIITDFLRRHDALNCPFAIINDESTESGILNFVREHNFDMISIGTHGKRGLSKFFSGSISEDLVNHAFCPVLTVNINKGN